MFRSFVADIINSNLNLKFVVWQRC